MPDREKVIKDLDQAIEILSKVDAPTFWLDFVRVAVENALELLKGQEPRVLTLEEARTYEVVWPEDKGEGELHPLIVQNNMNDSKHYKYGIHWRVWSAKPTNEQRKAVKWE